MQLRNLKQIFSKISRTIQNLIMKIDFKVKTFISKAIIIGFAECNKITDYWIVLYRQGMALILNLDTKFEIRIEGLSFLE